MTATNSFELQVAGLVPLVEAVLNEQRRPVDSVRRRPLLGAGWVLVTTIPHSLRLGRSITRLQRRWADEFGAEPADAAAETGAVLERLVVLSVPLGAPEGGQLQVWRETSERATAATITWVRSGRPTASEYTSLVEPAFQRARHVDLGLAEAAEASLALDAAWREYLANAG